MAGLDLPFAQPGAAQGRASVGYSESRIHRPHLCYATVNKKTPQACSCPDSMRGWETKRNKLNGSNLNSSTTEAGKSGVVAGTSRPFCPSRSWCSCRWDCAARTRTRWRKPHGVDEQIKSCGPVNSFLLVVALVSDMAVDDSPASPSAPPQSSSQSAAPGSASALLAGQEPSKLYNRKHHLSSPDVAKTMAPASATSPGYATPMKFEDYLRKNPEEARKMLKGLSEVSGCCDEKLLLQAFNASSKQNSFCLTTAIDWMLSRPSTSGDCVDSFSNQVMSPVSKSGATGGIPPASAVVSHLSVTKEGPVPPPNSPNTSEKESVIFSDASANENIDLDLEKAIKMSLEDIGRNTASFGGGQISLEDQDVSRALEESLMCGNKRKRAETWEDPLNPHDRERNGMWPVGLKNVGQTCWFSAVIQSLFNLPAFRSLVLHYQPPVNAKSDLDTNKQREGSPFDDRQRKVIEFMLELRHLFALMVASHRKYVDPSRAVDILRGSLGSMHNEVSLASRSQTGGNPVGGTSDNDQQDVSEFTHIVLEWLEEAFKESLTARKSLMQGKMVVDEESNDHSEKENNEEKETPGAGSGSCSSQQHSKNEDKCATLTSDSISNPMTKLFYGKVLIEGSNQGEEFSRVEAFGQWPLQVASYNNIHESLENSTAHEYFNSSVDHVDDSGQERWFTQLPPVLFFELSRFQYNTERRLAEKIHNKLEFTEAILMDRYMFQNKNVTRRKREEVRHLKERRRILQEQLLQFTFFGQGSETAENSSGVHIPIPQVLTHTLAFAMSGQSDHLDRGEAQPSQGCSILKMHVDSPCHSPHMTPASSVSNLNVMAMASDSEVCPMEIEEDEPISLVDAAASSKGPGCEPSSKAPAPDVVVPMPVPKYVSQQELMILQTCLTRWKAEVQESMDNLKRSIEMIDTAIENMYDSDESLQSHEYRLHAVMVHEGTIDSGHYWAYVRDHKRNMWLKFNDNSVTEVTWEELAKESVGGHSNASAYSLVYIDASKPELLSDGNKMPIAEDNASLVNKKENEGDEIMDEDVDHVLHGLPDDLCVYVQNDNHTFKQEIAHWDKEQRDQQEALKAAAAKSSKLSTTSSTDQASMMDNDVQVVQESLTHVNSHARLSLEWSLRVIKELEPTILEMGPERVVEMAVDQLRNLIESHIKNAHQSLKCADNTEASSVHTLPEISPVDIRLDSFIVYMMQNSVKSESSLIKLALLEQLAYPGLETNEPAITSFRQTSAQMLNQKRRVLPDLASELNEWHQGYHLFRLSYHCLICGIEAFIKHNFHQALDFFSDTYNYTMLIRISKPKGSMKTIHCGNILRFLCLTLPEVNNSIIKQFQQRDRLREVVPSIQSIVVPALNILQSRVNNAPHMAKVAQEAHTLEDVRKEWCALLGSQNDSTKEAGMILTQVLSIILDTETFSPKMSRNSNHVNLKDDLKLSHRYKECVLRLQENLKEK